jgi:hypothetical protein
MVNGKRDSVNSTGVHKHMRSVAQKTAGKKRSQSEDSPTRIRAINPPSSNAARIQTATCGRLRISPRGGSIGRANSSSSSPVSSTGWRAVRSAAGVAAGSRGSSLNFCGTATMLALKKSMRQAKARAKSVVERRVALKMEAAAGEISAYLNSIAR